MMNRIPAICSRPGKPAASHQYPAAPRRGRTVALAACVLLLLAALAAAGELRAPRIVLPEPKYDFGAVPAGRPAEHVFEVRNGGDAVLEIRKVQPTWGCAAGLVSADRLEGGKSAQVKVSVDTTGRSGLLVKHVVIHTNDPVSPVATLTLIMQVVPTQALP